MCKFGSPLFVEVAEQFLLYVLHHAIDPVLLPIPIIQTIGARSNVESPLALTATPFSVTMAVTNSAGVTSKLGL